MEPQEQSVAGKYLLWSVCDFCKYHKKTIEKFVHLTEPKTQKKCSFAHLFFLTKWYNVGIIEVRRRNAQIIMEVY